MTGSIVRFLGIIIGKGPEGSGSFSWGRNWWDWGEVEALYYTGVGYSVRFER